LKRIWSLAILVFGVALSAFLLVACGGSKVDDSAALAAHRWKAVIVTGMSAANGQPLTAAFEGGTVTGSTGINQYRGIYETRLGNGISIKIGPMTRAAGTPEAMKLEEAYTTALGQAASYRVDASKLTLLDSSGTELVIYGVYKPAALTGAQWMCTMYNNGRGAFQSVATSSTITASFGDDGKMSGRGGVNEYNTTYTTSGNTISIAPPVATRLAGPQDLMDQEGAYFAAIANASTYVIEGSNLTLRAADGAALAGYVAK